VITAALFLLRGNLNIECVEMRVNNCHISSVLGLLPPQNNSENVVWQHQPRKPARPPWLADLPADHEPSEPPWSAHLSADHEPSEPPWSAHLSADNEPIHRERCDLPKKSFLRTNDLSRLFNEWFLP